MNPPPSSSILRVTSLPPLVIAAWYGVPTVADTKRLRDELEQVAAAGAGVALLDILVSGRPAFTDDARAAVAALIRGVECRLGVAHVVLMGGIPGTAARMFLSTVTLLGRTSSPSKVFDQLDPALQWLHAHGCPVAREVILRSTARLLDAS